MLVAPYRKVGDETPYDEFLEQNISVIHDYIKSEDDDYQVMLAGKRGSGKSTLAKHAITKYMPAERLSIKQISLSREDFADSLKHMQEQPLPRAICYDEANVNIRDSMTKWNKDLIDLYYSNRGLNFFHIWCNPSIQNIDKTFLDDCIKAVIVVKKSKKKNKDSKISPFRYYYWYNTPSLLKVLEKYGSIKIDILLDRKVRKKFAWYRGWFKDYTGVLKEEYLEKKDARMKLKTEQFFEKYGNSELLKRSEVVRQLGISDDTLRNHMDCLIQGEDYFVSATGNYRFSNAAVNKVRTELEESKKAKLSNLALGHKNKGGFVEQ